MTVQPVVSATDGHRRSDPGFLPGLLKTQKCRVGTFTKLLVGTLAFSQRCSISYHIQDVILNLEGKADAFCVLVEYWQSTDALYLRRLMHKANGGANQCAGFMTMNTLKRVQRYVFAFRV